MHGRLDAKQEWQRDWPLPLIGMLCSCMAVTHLYALGASIIPIQRDLGWTRATITSGLAIASVVSVTCAPFVGMLIDKYGPRRIALPGVPLYCAALACLSLTGRSAGQWWALWAFFATTLVLVKPTVWVTAVVSRFDATRGLAMALTLCGTGLGATLLPLLAGQLITRLGWREAFLALGVGWCLIALPLVFQFFHGADDRPRQAQQRQLVQRAKSGTSFGAALTSTVFMRIALCGLIATAACVALLVHMVSILRGFGLQPTLAAALAGLLGIGSIIGRIGVGFLLDRVPASRVGIVAFSMPIIALIALVTLDVTPAVAGAACLLLGLAIGAELDVVGYMTSRYFGTAAFGAIFGSIMGLLGLASGMGPLIASLIFDATGGYRALLIGLIPAFMLCVSLIVNLGPYPESSATGAMKAT